MINYHRNILIPIIVLLAASMPRADAQTNSQLSLTLLSQDPGQYVTPAGQTTRLKLQILNVAHPDVYLLQGDLFLDPDLNGTWELVRSEQLGSFHLSFLQSAIWTFDLTIPANIQSGNVTGGSPRVNFLIKIIYQTIVGAQDVGEHVFSLSVPGAIVQQPYDVIWYEVPVALILVGIGTGFLILTKRRQRH